MTEVDKENKRVKVSHKALEKNPYPDCLTRYQKGQEALGIVTGIEEYGIFVNLEPAVDILCKNQKIGSKRITVGDRVTVGIIEINQKKERMYGKLIRKI